MRRSHRKALTILLAALIFIVSVAGILSSIATERYWARPHLQDITWDLDKDDDADDEMDTTKTIVYQCNEEATTLREELSPFFAACDQMIVEYFRDSYNVDVTEKLDALQIMESTYPEAISQMVGGSYYTSFGDKLFINRAVLDSFSSDRINGELLDATSDQFSAKMLRTVYIHEVMHYLGVSRDRGLGHFAEALAECLNKKVMLHNGIKYESITGYATIQNFAEQIIACDPDLVKAILTQDESPAAERFAHMLGEWYSADYDELIGLLQKDNGKDQNKFTYYAQYLTNEYCKATNSDARAILKNEAMNTVRFFELKWLLGIY